MSDVVTKKVGEFPVEVLDLIKGFPTSRAEDRGDIPVMSIAALRNGDSPKLFADRRNLEDVFAKKAEVGDVLVAVEGGTVGEVMVVIGSDIGFVASQQVLTLRVGDQGQLSPWYLGAWLRSERGQAGLSRLIKGSGIKRIAYRDLLTLEIDTPPYTEQVHIGELFRTFQESIEAHELIASSLKRLMEIEIEVAVAPMIASATKTGGSR